MRAIWTGALSFGLVNIPVRLYSATAGEKLSFDMLHKKDLSPIRYARICKADGKEVPYEDIVKGYKYEDGDYVVLTDDDFKKANVKKTKTIEIQDFTKESEIDPIYFEKPYYLEPDKGSAKPYALLRESLKKSKKVGIAKFVLRNRELLAVVKPYGNAIIIEQLRYKKEIRPTEELTLPETSSTNKEVEMALKLIEQLTTHFKPEKYKDTYEEELRDVIEAKAKGRKPKVKGKEPEPTEVRDIMALLQQSLESHQKERKKVR